MTLAIILDDKITLAAELSSSGATAIRSVSRGSGAAWRTPSAMRSMRTTGTRCASK